MTLNEEATMLSSKGGYQETWKDVFQANLDALFQLALLLTADSQEAEAKVATVISTLDFSKQIDKDALAVIQGALVPRVSEVAGSSPWRELRELGPCFNPVCCLFCNWSDCPVSVLSSACCSDTPLRPARGYLASTNVA